MAEVTIPFISNNVGNIGVGTDSPTELFHVAGIITASIVTASLFNGDLDGTAYLAISSSWTSHSLSSSLSIRSQNAFFASQSRWAVSASWASTSLTSVTSSYTHRAQNAIFASQSFWAVSASWASSSVTSDYTTLARSSSYASSSLSSSWAPQFFQSNTISSSYASSSTTVTSIENNVTNNVDNRILTATGGDTINAESGLTYNGTVLSLFNTNITSGSVDSGSISLGLRMDAGEGFSIYGNQHFYGFAQDAIIFQMEDSNAAGGVTDGGFVFRGFSPTLTQGTASNWMTIKSGPSIGIGTMFPVSSLQVVGHISASGFGSGSFHGTASYANKANVAASSVFASQSIWAVSASWASSSLTSVTSSFTHKAQNTIFASQSFWAVSASWASSSISSSYAPFTQTYQSNTISSSFASSSLSSSYASTASLVPNAFIQGGNSFGTTAILGTNDVQSLSLETNGITRLTINSNGFVGINTAASNNNQLSIVSFPGDMNGNTASLNVQTSPSTGSCDVGSNNVGIYNLYTLNHPTTFSTTQVQALYNQTTFAVSSSYTGSFRVMRNATLLTNGTKINSAGALYNTFVSNQLVPDTNEYQLDCVYASIASLFAQTAQGVSGSVVSFRHFYCHSPSFSGNQFTASNVAGLWIDAQKINNVTTGYGIVQSGTDDYNYFAGNVGIGTSTPLTLLHVFGHISASGFGSGSLQGTSSYADRSTVSITSFFASQSFWAVSASWASSSVTSSYSHKSQNAFFASQSRWSISSSFASTSLNTRTSSYSITASYVEGAVPVFTGKTDNYLPKWSSNTLTGTSNIYDDGTNVGIGTDNPLYSLTIRENSNSSILGLIVDDASLRIPGVYLINNSSTEGTFRLEQSSQSPHSVLIEAGTGGSTYTAIKASGSAVLQLMPDGGTVGVNTTNPKSSLHVFGHVSASSFGSGSLHGTASYANKSNISETSFFASQSFWAVSASLSSQSLIAVTASYTHRAQNAFFASQSFWAVSASWASSSLTSTTSSYTHRAQNAFFASQSRWSLSSSFASSSITSSYSVLATSASYVPIVSGITGGSAGYVTKWSDTTTLTTGSIIDENNLVTILENVKHTGSLYKDYLQIIISESAYNNKWLRIAKFNILENALEAPGGYLSDAKLKLVTVPNSTPGASNRGNYADVSIINTGFGNQSSIAVTNAYTYGTAMATKVRTSKSGSAGTWYVDAYIENISASATIDVLQVILVDGRMTLVSELEPDTGSSVTETSILYPGVHNSSNLEYGFRVEGNELFVSASTNPLRLIGVQSAVDTEFLSISSTGVVRKGSTIPTSSVSTTSSYTHRAQNTFFASQSFWAVSASWASSSLTSTTSSYSHKAQNTFFASQSIWATSASFASSSLTASWANSANSVFIGKVSNYVPKWVDNVLTATSSIMDSGSVVGIGTFGTFLSPNRLLHIGGNDPSGSTGTANVALRLTNTNIDAAGKVSELQFAANNQQHVDSQSFALVTGYVIGAGFGTYSQGDLSLTTRASTGDWNTGVWIKNTGNVGIGTSTPQSLLHVFGQVSASGFTGSLQGTSSYSDRSSVSITSFFASQSRWSISSSYASNSLSSSYATLARSASYYPSQTYQLNTISASWASKSYYSDTSGDAETLDGLDSTYFQSALITGATYSITTSFAQTSSKVVGGSTNYITRWLDSTTLTTSSITDNTSVVTVFRNIKHTGSLYKEVETFIIPFDMYNDQWIRVGQYSNNAMQLDSAGGYMSPTRIRLIANPSNGTSQSNAGNYAEVLITNAGYTDQASINVINAYTYGTPIITKVRTSKSGSDATWFVDAFITNISSSGENDTIQFILMDGKFKLNNSASTNPSIGSSVTETNITYPGVHNASTTDYGFRIEGNKLLVSSSTNPLNLIGVQTGTDTEFLTIDGSGVVRKNSNVPSSSIAISSSYTFRAQNAFFASQSIWSISSSFASSSVTSSYTHRAQNAFFASQSFLAISASFASSSVTSSYTHRAQNAFFASQSRWSVSSSYSSRSTAVDGFTGNGIADYVAKWTDANTLSTGLIRDDGTGVSINTTPTVSDGLIVSKAFTSDYVGELYGIRLSLVVTSTGSSFRQSYRTNVVLNHTTGTITNYSDFLGYSQKTDGGIVSNMYGYYCGGVVTSGSIVNHIAFRSTAFSLNGGTIDNQIGFDVGGLSGSIGSTYGIRSQVSNLRSNYYNLYVDGTAQNYFAGNVGIGTSSPQSKLHIFGHVSASGFGSGSLQGTASYANRSNVSATTLFASQSFWAISASFASSSIQSNRSLFASQSFWAISASFASSSVSSSWADLANPVFTSKTDNYLPKWSSNTLTGTSTIYDIGSVGINTISPQSLLHVFGHVSASSFGSGSFHGTASYANRSNVSATTLFASQSRWAVSSSWASSSLTASYISNAFIQGGNSFSATAVLGTNDAQSLSLETNGTTRFTINSNGFVGINASATTNVQLNLAMTPGDLNGASSSFTITTTPTTGSCNTSANNVGMLNYYVLNHPTTNAGTQVQAAYTQLTLNVSSSLSGSFRVVRNASLLTSGVKLNSAGYLYNTLATNQIAPSTNRLQIDGVVTSYASFIAQTAQGISGSLNSFRHFYAQSPSFSGAEFTASTVAGLYIDAQKATNITTAYGVYLAGTSDYNYFGGNVGIGTTVPISKLHTVHNTTNWVSVTYNPNNNAAVSQSNGLGYGMSVDCGDNADSSTYALNVNKGGSTYLEIRGDGYVGINASPSTTGQVYINSINTSTAHLSLASGITNSNSSNNYSFRGWWGIYFNSPTFGSTGLYYIQIYN